MRTAVADVLYVLRVLSRTPSFAIAVVAVLALGIGANTAIFSIVNAVLLRPLPFEEPDRLGRLFHEPPQNKRRVQLPLRQVSVHSQTFPIMSYKPKALGLKLPTGAVFLLSHSLPHPSQLA